jgi:HD superfamily phosphohydrolase
MSDSRETQARSSQSDASQSERKPRATGWLQPISLRDALYGSVRVSGWAAALLEAAPFQRLAGVSLSDVPGPLLFGQPFPSRLDHAIGVYHLTRLARPRDRALQAAALAHDLGHGPFSHLTEPLMLDQLGIDHEQRSARLILVVRDALAPWIRRYLGWLDWDEVAALVQGQGGDGRGALLNGLLDYDNVDNIARFLVASGLGAPGYDPVTLARGLSLSVDDPSATAATPVLLSAAAADDARAWQHDRRIVYDYLRRGEHNLALRAMLRKAIDLAATDGSLAPDFLDYTDDGALAHLAASPLPGVDALLAGVASGMEYRRVWEANLGPEHNTLMALLAGRDERLGLEALIASESGFAAHEVIVESIVSSTERALPPLLGASEQDNARASRTRKRSMRLNVFAAPGAPDDYLRRLQIAAGRAFARFGVRPGAEIGV